MKIPSLSSLGIAYYISKIKEDQKKVLEDFSVLETLRKRLPRDLFVKIKKWLSLSPSKFSRWVIRGGHKNLLPYCTMSSGQALVWSIHYQQTAWISSFLEQTSDSWCLSRALQEATRLRDRSLMKKIMACCGKTFLNFGIRGAAETADLSLLQFFAQKKEEQIHWRGPPLSASIFSAWELVAAAKRGTPEVLSWIHDRVRTRGRFLRSSYYKAFRLAAHGNNFPAIEYFLTRVSNDAKGWSNALGWAICYRKYSLEKKLWKRAPALATLQWDKIVRGAILQGTIEKYLQIMKLADSYVLPNQDWRFSLAAAVARKDLFLVKFFLSKNVSSLKKAWKIAILVYSPEIFEVLLQAGAHNWNAGLEFATYTQNDELVEFFRLQGANNWNWIIQNSVTYNDFEIVRKYGRWASPSVTYNDLEIVRKYGRWASPQILERCLRIAEREGKVEMIRILQNSLS